MLAGTSSTGSNRQYGQHRRHAGQRQRAQGKRQSVGVPCHTQDLVVRIRLPEPPAYSVGAYPVGKRTLGMPVGAYWAFDADVSKIDTFRAFLAGYSGCQAKILNGKCQQRILSPFGASTKKFPPYTPSRREDLWNTSRRLLGRQEGPRNASRCLPPQTTCPVGACLVGERTLECQ